MFKIFKEKLEKFNPKSSEPRLFIIFHIFEYFRYFADASISVKHDDFDNEMMMMMIDD